MRVVKWVVSLVLLALVAAFLHYVLPKREVVYITSTENRIVSPDEYRGFRSFGEASTTATTGQIGADVFFVNTVRRDGGVLVFRNEDTGFGFPWYFKFDSANVQAEAQDAVSVRGSPNWVVARYYGWRIEFLSMFPNLVSLAPAASPDVRLVPWFNIIFFVLVIAVLWAIAARIRRWRQRRADPAVTAWQPEPTRRGWFRR